MHLYLHNKSRPVLLWIYLLILYNSPKAFSENKIHCYLYFKKPSLSITEINNEHGHNVKD